MLDNETNIIETFGYEQWLEQQQQQCLKYDV